MTPDPTKAPDVAQAGPGVSGWTNTAANLSAVAVLCWLVTTEMPRQQDSFRQELRAIRQHDETRTDRLVAAMTENQRAFLQLTEELRRSRELR